MSRAATVSKMFCPGGPSSQTGSAVLARYGNIEIITAGKSVPDVDPLIDKKPGPFAIPIWNSHQGEIKPAGFLWKRVRLGTIWISDLWAKRIEFWWLRRIGDTESHKKIGSVLVAKMQCSDFLDRHGLELDGRGLTTVAYDEYVSGQAWDGVLVADEHYVDKAMFEIVDYAAANPNNFTTFVSFESVKGQKKSKRAAKNWLTGITMPRIDATVAEDTRALLNEIIDAPSIDELPKLTFVFDWVERIGLLFEGPKLLRSDILDAETMQNRDIEVHEQVGSISIAYSENLFSLCQSKFKQLTSKDFVIHEGKNTCLFLCPTLGLYMHGFNAEAVDPVFRFYVNRLFILWSNSQISCTTKQDKFFKKYKKAWMDRGMDFVNFLHV